MSKKVKFNDEVKIVYFELSYEEKLNKKISNAQTILNHTEYRHTLNMSKHCNISLDKILKQSQKNKLPPKFGSFEHDPIFEIDEDIEMIDAYKS